MHIYKLQIIIGLCLASFLNLPLLFLNKKRNAPSLRVPFFKERECLFLGYVKFGNLTAGLNQIYTFGAAVHIDTYSIGRTGCSRSHYMSG